MHKSHSRPGVLQPCWAYASKGVRAGNVIHEPHLPPRDKKVKHFSRPLLTPDVKAALERDHLALKSTETSAKLKPVNRRSTTKTLTSYYCLKATFDILALFNDFGTFVQNSQDANFQAFWVLLMPYTHSKLVQVVKMPNNVIDSIASVERNSNLVISR